MDGDSVDFYQCRQPLLLRRISSGGPGVNVQRGTRLGSTGFIRGVVIVAGLIGAAIIMSGDGRESFSLRGRQVFLAEEVDQCTYPLESQTSLLLQSHAASFAQVCFRVTSPIRRAAQHLPLSRLPILSRVASMKHPPCALPVWNAESQLRNASKEVEQTCIDDRWAFWAIVMFIMWLSMPALPFFWYLIFIYRGGQDRAYAEHPWSTISQRSLKGLFVLYHFLHNIVLCCITVVAVIYGYMTEGFNWDWELWVIWLLWLLIVLNITSFVKYRASRGVRLSFPIVEILTLVLPGFGNDAHLAKDWLFIGLSFQKMLCPVSRPDVVIAGSLGILSICVVFFPMTLSFRLPDESHAATGYIASHWPTVMATPVVPVSSRSWKEWYTVKIIPQVSYAKQLSAVGNELPQVVLETLFGLYFGFSPSLVRLLLLSLLKPFLIWRVRGFIAAGLASAQNDQDVDVNAIVEYFKANGDRADLRGMDPIQLCLTEDSYVVAAPALLAIVGNVAEMGRAWLQWRLSPALATATGPDAMLVAWKLAEAGFTTQQLKDVGFTAQHLKEAAFTAQQLKDVGFTVQQLKAAGFTAQQLKDVDTGCRIL